MTEDEIKKAFEEIILDAYNQMGRVGQSALDDFARLEAIGQRVSKMPVLRLPVNYAGLGDALRVVNAMCKTSLLRSFASSLSYATAAAMLRLAGYAFMSAVAPAVSIEVSEDAWSVLRKLGALADSTTGADMRVLTEAAIQFHIQASDLIASIFAARLRQVPVSAPTYSAPITNTGYLARSIAVADATPRTVRAGVVRSFTVGVSRSFGPFAYGGAPALYGKVLNKPLGTSTKYAKIPFRNIQFWAKQRGIPESSVPAIYKKLKTRGVYGRGWVMAVLEETDFGVTNRLLGRAVRDAILKVK